MTDHVDDPFKLRPRPPRSRGGPRAQRFLGRVQIEVERAGGIARGVRASSRPSARAGRGFAVGRVASAVPAQWARRVVVKARIVYLRQAGSAATHAHLQYLAREGVGRADKDLPYSAGTDQVDLEAFESRGANDRHQFRFIVAPEDAAEIEDLRGFTRHLMDKAESDLGTRLDWIAVDHWDTDNPHTHIVVRGKEPSGKDLVIAGEYISSGMRFRASEIATSWLGRRNEVEIEASLRRDVGQDRWTSLDRRLQSRCRDGRIDLRSTPKAPLDPRARALLVGRMQRLQSLGLARQDPQAQWWLRDDAEAVLRDLGERGDIIRTMQRAIGSARRDYAIFDGAQAPSPVVGRVAGKGLVDELGDHAFLVVDGMDGRAHYVTLRGAPNLADFPVDGIVEIRANGDRKSDRNIVAAATSGVYRTDLHAAQLRASSMSVPGAADVVAGHVRRLEALRRARIVERLGEGVWRVPADLVERGRRYDRHRLGSANVQLLSHLPIERQVRAVGATWLDRQIVDAGYSSAHTGFAVPVQHALQKREEFLAGQGLARRDGTRVVLARNLLARLRDRELATAAAALAAETGLTHRPLVDGATVSGTYRGSLQLASGRFAMLESGLGFSLVPWRPVVESRLGKSITASMRHGHISLDIGRTRGIAR